MSANIITLTRVLLAMVTLVMFQMVIYFRVAALPLMIIVFYMDSPDGYVARKLGIASDFGALLDITGDRIVEHVYWIFIYRRRPGQFLGADHFYQPEFSCRHRQKYSVQQRREDSFWGKEHDALKIHSFSHIWQVYAWPVWLHEALNVCSARCDSRFRNRHWTDNSSFTGGIYGRSHALFAILHLDYNGPLHHPGNTCLVGWPPRSLRKVLSAGA